MGNNSSKENILGRLRNAPEPAWDYDSDLLNDSFNGFDKPEFLLDSFLSRLEAVKGTGTVVEGVAAFALQIKNLQAENGWPAIYCSIPDLISPLKLAGVELLAQEPETGSHWIALTACEYLIALTGSVLVSSESGPGRKIHAGPEIHMVYAGVSQLQPFIVDGYREIAGRGLPSWIGLITGPSRTADIEKTLVLGAHGPKKLMVFIDRTL